MHGQGSKFVVVKPRLSTRQLPIMTIWVLKSNGIAQVTLPSLGAMIKIYFFIDQVKKFIWKLLQFWAGLAEIFAK